MQLKHVLTRTLLKVISILKPGIYFGGIDLVLLTLKYRVVSFPMQNKSVTVPSFACTSDVAIYFAARGSHCLVLIKCRQFVKDGITLKLYKYFPGNIASLDTTNYQM